MSLRTTVSTLLAAGFGFLAAQSSFAQTAEVVVAEKTAMLVNDADGDGKASPGDTLRYTISVTNTGDVDALGVQLVDMVDPATLMIDTNSINALPTAVDDSYATTGGVQLIVGVADGVLDNDFDTDNHPQPLTVSAFDNPSAGGGSVNINSNDGSFTYSPAPGFSGQDTFDYEITDGLATAGAAVTIDVAEMADLSVTKSDDADPVSGGAVLTYTITVSNAGPTAASGITVVDTLPSGVNLGMATSGGGGFVCSNPAPGVVMCSGGAIGASGVETIDIQVTAATSGFITNSVTVSTTAIDTNAANDTAFEVTFIENAPPAAVDDNYSTFINVQLSIDMTSGVLSNDFDPDLGDTIFVSSFDSNSMLGGIVNVETNGAFTYDPPAAAAGTDTFAYVVSDGSATDTGLVEVVIGGATVWFVDNNVAGPGSGTSGDPFSDLSSLNGGGGGGDVDGPGEIIFVFEGSGPYAGGIPLEADQQLLGEPAGLILSGEVIVAPGSSPPVISSSGTNAIDLTHGVVVRSITAEATNGSGMAAVSVANITVDVSRVASSGGPALSILSGGTNLDLTFGELFSTNSSGHGVEIDGLSGSSLIVTGATTVLDPGSAGIQIQNSGGESIDLGVTTVSCIGAAGDGINLETGNSGATFMFDSMAVDTSNGAGIRANDSTILIGGTANTILVSGHPGFDLTGTTISGVFFSVGANDIASNGTSFNNVSGDLQMGNVSIVCNGSGTSLLVNNAAMAVGDFTLRTTGGMVTGNGGTGIDFNKVTMDMTLSAVNATGTPGIGIKDSAGTLNAIGGAVTGSGTSRVSIDGGAATISYGGSITHTSGTSVDIRNRTGGSVTLSGSINDTGAGIDVMNNSGGTITFSGSSKVLNTGVNTAVNLNGNAAAINLTGGGLDIDTTSGTGFSATGGGTVNISGPGNTVTSTTGTGINIQNTAIAGAGVTFQSVSVNGAAVGIDIDGGGTAGFFTITGVGATAGSGGTIRNTIQNGILIENTDNITLANLNLVNATDEAGGCLAGVDQTSSILGPCTAALEFNTVSTIQVNNMTIDGDGDLSDELGIFAQQVTNFDMNGVTVQNVSDAIDEHAIYVVNLLGTAAASTDSHWEDVVVLNTVGDTGILIVQVAGTGELLLDGASSIVNAKEGGLEVRTDSATANLTVTVGNTSAVGSGDTVLIDNSNIGAAFFAEGGSLSGTLRNSLLRSGSGSFSISRAGSGNNGVLFVGITGQSTSPTADNTLTATGNDIDLDDGGALGTGHSGIALGGSGNVNGVVANNMVDSDDEFVDGLFMNFTGVGSTSDNQVTVDNNVFNMVGSGGNDTIAGIEINASDSSGGLSVAVTGNDITYAGDNAFSAGLVVVAGDSGGGDNNVLCVDVRNNKVTSTNAGSFGHYGFVQFSAATLNIEGVGLGVVNDAQVDAYITANDDPAAATTGADINATVGTINGVTSCP